MKQFLKVAAKIAGTLKYPHTVIGSVALAVDKIADVTPNDLDILVDVRDFKRLFPDITQHTLSESGKLSSYLAVVQVDGVQVEVVSDVCQDSEKGPKVSFGWLRNYERIDGRVLSFAKPVELLRFYRLLGRDKDLAKIKLIQNKVKSRYF